MGCGRGLSRLLRGDSKPTRGRREADEEQARSRRGAGEGRREAGEKRTSSSYRLSPALLLFPSQRGVGVIRGITGFYEENWNCRHFICAFRETRCPRSSSFALVRPRSSSFSLVLSRSSSFRFSFFLGIPSQVDPHGSAQNRRCSRILGNFCAMLRSFIQKRSAEREEEERKTARLTLTRDENSQKLTRVASSLLETNAKIISRK